MFQILTYSPLTFISQFFFVLPKFFLTVCLVHSKSLCMSTWTLQAFIENWWHVVPEISLVSYITYVCVFMCAVPIIFMLFFLLLQIILRTLLYWLTLKSYKIIFLSDNYWFPLPVGLFITLSLPGQLTAHTCIGAMAGNDKW